MRKNPCVHFCCFSKFPELSNELCSMKKIGIIILVFTLSFIACNKDDSDKQSDCSNSFRILVDKDWFPPVESADSIAVLRFDSNNDYYENEVYAGTWEFESDCNSIHFYVGDFGGLDFQYEIISLSEGTLKIRTTSGAVIIYHTLAYLIG